MEPRVPLAFRATRGSIELDRGGLFSIHTAPKPMTMAVVGYILRTAKDVARVRESTDYFTRSRGVSP